MAVQNDNGFKAYTAGEDLAAYRRVRFNSSGNLVYADAEESTLGITQADCSSGDTVTIKLITAPGTFKIEASEAVTFAVSTDERGPLLYGADDGKVSDTAGTKVLFNALEASDGAGAIIECLPYTIPN